MKTVNQNRKSTYEVNPERRASNKIYKTLSLTERAMYGALLDLCWLGDTQYSIIKDEQRWASDMGVDVSEVESFIAKVSSTKLGDALIEESFDLSSASFMIIFLELKEQMDSYQAWLLRERQLASVKNNMEKKSVSLLEMSKDRSKAIEGAVHYLDPSERFLVDFKGWLPTTSFDAYGQIYKIRDFVIEELRSIYPDVDVVAEFQKMFFWFSNPKNQRRSVAQMNWFIHKWFERAATGWQNQSRQDISLSDEVNRLLEEELKQAVNE